MHRNDFDLQSELKPDFKSDKNSVLPDELPPRLDLSHLPPRIVHSSAIETLLGQNDDLYARLKVVLRRASLLEGQLLDLEYTNEDLARSNAALQMQTQTFIEKENIWREKMERSESQQAKSADLLRRSEGDLGKLKNELAELDLLRRYRRRMDNWGRRGYERLRRELQANKEENLKKEALISDLRHSVSESDDDINRQAREFSRDQAKLVEQYESAQQSLASEIETLIVEKKSLLERASLVETASRNEAAAQNRMISLEREIEALKRERDTLKRDFRRTTLQSQLDREEIKRLKLRLQKAEDAAPAEIPWNSKELGFVEGEQRNGTEGEKSPGAESEKPQSSATV